MTRPIDAPSSGVFAPGIQTRGATTGSTWVLKNSPQKGMLAGSIISAQARHRGVGKSAVNPLADKADWSTGGRMTSPAAAMANGKGMVGLITFGGIALVLALIMRRK